jgi:hypothetical protein
LDEISQGPRRDVRLPAARWLAVAAAAGLAAVITTLVVTGGGGRRPAVPPHGPGPLAAPSPAAAAGTVLLACGSAAGGSWGSDWRAGSLRAGPVWFADGRQFGYVRYGRPHGAGRAIQRRGRLHLVVMVVEVDSGSTVVIKPAPGARPYFRFVDGFHPGGGNGLPAGESGFTFVSCPRGHAGPNGQVTGFYLGFPSGQAARLLCECGRLPRPARSGSLSLARQQLRGERRGSSEAGAFPLHERQIHAHGSGGRRHLANLCRLSASGREDP